MDVETPVGPSETFEVETTVYEHDTSITTLTQCTKHPGHEEYIPVGMFSPFLHLPEAYRDENVVDFLKERFDLTVHLSVDVISEFRPALVPESTRPYPFHQPHGGRFFRQASGFVCHVFKCGEGGELKKEQTCGCYKCRSSGNFQKTWYEFRVVTAAHVVFDGIEAKQTTVKLFFDDIHEKPVILKGEQEVCTDVAGDRCSFVCVSHDAALGEMMVAKSQRCVELYESLADKFRAMDDDPSTEKEDIPVVILSHPHGLRKHMTVGTWVMDFEKKKEEKEKEAVDQDEQTSSSVSYSSSTTSMAMLEEQCADGGGSAGVKGENCGEGPILRSRSRSRSTTKSHDKGTNRRLRSERLKKRHCNTTDEKRDARQNKQNGQVKSVINVSEGKEQNDILKKMDKNDEAKKHHNDEKEDDDDGDDDNEDEPACVAYTAWTCAGCSGSWVWRLGGQGHWYPVYPHSRCQVGGYGISGGLWGV